ncbi:MAG TPA: hypothetical protein VHA73_13650 [Acidimicrobiales bacterium]|nr:hypothetical protein [Acidimicrobiales bacterium]
MGDDPTVAVGFPPSLDSWNGRRGGPAIVTAAAYWLVEASQEAAMVESPQESAADRCAEPAGRLFESPAVHGLQLCARTWTEALIEIEEELAALLATPGWYIVFDVARDDDVFVQFAHCPEGQIMAEAAASRRCGPRCGPRRHELPAVEQAGLLRLGWDTPDLPVLELPTAAPGHPNFFKLVDVADGWPPALLSELAVRTLHEIWDVDLTEVFSRWGDLECGCDSDRV